METWASLHVLCIPSRTLEVHVVPPPWHAGWKVQPTNHQIEKNNDDDLMVTQYESGM